MNVVRFIANIEYGVLLELAPEGASASLAARYHGEFGNDPDYETVAVAGITFDLGEGQRGCCISRSPSVESANEAIRLLAAKYGPMQRSNRPPYGTGSEQGTTSGIDWTFDLERRRYDSTTVEIFPAPSSRPVADKVVIEYADQLTFVHRARRDPRCDWCQPAATVEDALTFSAVEGAQEWIEKRGATERQPLLLRWRSVALARMDQSDAGVNDGMRG